MITFQREMLYEVVGEVEPLLAAHYEELTLNKHRIKLSPAWAEYRALESVGRFTLFTARDDGRLAGYNAFFVHRHMHYIDLNVAFNDVLFLAPEYRQGTTGIRLVKHAECLKDEGVDKICYHAKLDTNLIPILHRLGYKTEELMLGKLF